MTGRSVSLGKPHFPKEEYIRHAGDPADFIGIVESGSIHVLQDDYYGNRNITASISEGSLFGEAFSCAGIPYLPVDIVAAEDCNIMFLNGKKLLNTCDNGCEAVKCIYNSNYKCVADHVDIKGCGACDCRETACATFTEK